MASCRWLVYQAELNTDGRGLETDKHGAIFLGFGRMFACLVLGICKPFPKTNLFQWPALKLTHLLGGKARACCWIGLIVFPSVCGSRCHGTGGGSTTGQPVLQSACQLWFSPGTTAEISNRQHMAIPGVPARLILCFSVVSLPSHSGRSRLWRSVYEKKLITTNRTSTWEGVSEAVPKSSQEEAVFVLISRPLQC